MGTLREAVRGAIGDFYGDAMGAEDVDALTEEIVRRVYPAPEGAGTVISTEGREVAICGHPEWTLWLPEHRAARVEWPWWEKPRLESMWRNLRPGDVLFDIGTEEGDQSALYARWIADEAESGGIVLVEPNPLVWPNVKAIFERNGMPAPLACWVGFTGDVRTDLSPLPADWPDRADGPMIGDHGFSNLCERPDIPVTTIDVLAMNVALPDAITIDIEGAELVALHGARETLRGCRPLVWVSIHPEFSRDLYGTSRDDLLAFMAGLGYRYEHLAAEHEHHVFFWHPEGRAPVLPYGGT